MNFNKYFCNEEIIYIMGTSMILYIIGFLDAEPRLSSLMLHPFKHIHLYLYEGSNDYHISKKEQGIWYILLDHKVHRYWVRLV